MKVFKVEQYFTTPTIKEVECVRVSEKSIFFENNRVLRESWNCNFFNSYKEAVIFCIKIAKRKIEKSEQDIRYANNTIKKYKEFISLMEKEY